MASIRRLPRDDDERRAHAEDPDVPLTGRWQVRYRDVDNKQRGASFATKDEAKQYRAKVESQLYDGDWVDPAFGEATVGAWLKLWSESRILARTTAAAEESLLKNHVVPAFGKVPLNRVTKLRVQTWVASMERQGLSPATVSKVYRLLATALADAVEEGLLRQSPCRNIDLPAASIDERVFLTTEQVGVVVAELPRRYRALVLLAYFSGLRWSELAGLRVKRLDMLGRKLEVAEVAQEARGFITFGPPKSKASRRVVTLGQGVVDELALHLAMYPAGREDLVFTAARGGAMSRTIFARRVLRPAVTGAMVRLWAVDQGLPVSAAGTKIEPELLEAWERAGSPHLMPWPTFHSFRHSHVAALIADGNPMKAIQARIGHGSIKVTMDTYGHLEESVDEDLLAALDRRASSLGL
ncbi:MAG: integrase family protein [Frankiales bacterium]|nr:integrase family protein [Frankiales bacterium]